MREKAALKIAIVDPNTDSRESLRTELISYRDISQICCFGTAADYMHILEENIFQIVFVRVDSVKLNGISLTRKTHKIDPDTKIVFMSENDGLAVTSWDEGARGYLITPVTKPKLDITMKNILEDLDRINS